MSQPFDTLTPVVDSWVRLKSGRTGRVCGQTEDGKVCVSFQDKTVLWISADEVAVVPSLPLKLDAASLAAGKALAGDPDGYQHLMAICWKAVRGLWYPPARNLWSRANPVKQQEIYERARVASTAAFIENFLHTELHPYVGMSPVERQAAVDLGVFRYIGRRCRCRLIDVLRKETRRADPVDKALSIDAPMASGKPFSELLASPPNTAVQQDELLAHLANDREQLISEGGELWYNALVLLANLYPAVKKGDAVRAVAQVFGISDRQARNEMPRLIKRAWANLKRYRSATRRLYALLEGS